MCIRDRIKTTSQGGVRWHVTVASLVLTSTVYDVSPLLNILNDKGTIKFVRFSCLIMILGSIGKSNLNEKSLGGNKANPKFTS